MVEKNSLVEVLWDQVPAAMLLLDEAGSILDSNPAAGDLFPGAHDGGSLLSLLSGEDRLLFESKFHWSLQQREPSDVEIRVGAGDPGDGRLVGIGITPVVRGDQTLILVLARDIAGARRVGRRYRDVFERTTEPILLTSPDGSFIDCNPALEKLVGVSRERMQIEGVPDRFERGQADAPGEWETVFVTRDGSARHLRIRTGTYLVDATPVVVSFVRDRTAVVAAERRYERVFRQTAEAIAMVDRRGRHVIEANPAFERLSGFGAADLTRVACDTLWQLATLTWDELWNAREGQTLASLVSREGAKIPVELRWIPLEGEPDGGVMLVVRDLRGELKEAELERSLAMAQRTQALGQMASGIAHDFNNTLMAALPWADLLHRKFPEDPTIQKGTDHIRKAVRRAKEVTRHLLDFAQPKRPQKRRISLAELVRQQTRLMRPAIPPEIELTIDAEDEGWVEVDQNQIGQVLLNLALNARDAMADGGRIGFAIRRPTPSEAHRWDVSSAEGIVLSVSDTGHGISQTDLEVIFDPFFTTKGVGKGSGLGLPVVMRIVQQHGGGVYVDSKPGEGTTVFIVLPQAAEKASAPDAAPVSVAVQGQRFADRMFFLVDDEPAILEGLTAVLEGEGASVESWTRGSDLMEALASGRTPDLIVLDLGMPGISGKDVHRAIRERSTDVAVLISTGYGDAERLDPLLADGKTRYLQKPYESDVLFATIEELLGSPEGRSQAGSA